MALCDLVLSLGPTPLTCVPLAAVEHIPSAAHLLPFRFVLRLHLLTGHVATEASLDLGSSPVGLWVIQGDVHDVLLLLRPAALLLLRGPKTCVFFFFVCLFYTAEQYITIAYEDALVGESHLSQIAYIFCTINCICYNTVFLAPRDGSLLQGGSPSSHDFNGPLNNPH